MPNNIEVNDVIHVTGNKGFKVKTKPRNLFPNKGSKLKRDTTIKLWINLFILLAVAAFIMIKTGVI